MNKMTAKIITVDGPSGVGKGTISTLISNYFHFKILDSGALYRLAALNAIRSNIDIENPAFITKITENFKVHFEPPYIYLNGMDVTQDIRNEDIAKVASKIAVYGELRDNLFKLMQNFATPPGLVADGRDMGTVVFPHADLKIFLTASQAVRAERRYKQLMENQKNVSMDDVFSELEKRDKRDTDRLVAPLKPASDAIVINTDNLDVLQVFELVKKQAVTNGITPSLT